MTLLGACYFVAPCYVALWIMPMTPEEAAEMSRLCTLIQQEKDPDKFTRLVDQLNTFLEQREKGAAHGSTSQARSAA